MMRRLGVLFGVLTMVACEPDDSLRVMTWNIRGAQQASIERIAAVIRDEEPDVVALQELFFDAQWNGHVNLAAELERLTGRKATPLVTLEHTGPFGFEVAGQLVLTRDGVVLDPIELSNGRRVGARFDFRGINFATAHLPTDKEDRDEGLELLAGMRWQLLLGDLNTEDVAVLNAVTQSDCGPTFPSDAPARRIDWVLARNFDAGVCETVSTTASDHLPLIMQFGQMNRSMRRNEAVLLATTSLVLATFVDEHGQFVSTDDGLFNGATATCETGHAGVLTPCTPISIEPATVTVASGRTLSGSPLSSATLSYESVDSADGAARATAFAELPTRVPPGHVTALPLHPRNRRVDVKLHAGTSLMVTVERRVWDGLSYGNLERRFSTAPVTAEDLFDELATPGMNVAIPGTMFDQPGLYTVTSTPLAAGTHDGFGSRSGALVGRELSTQLWVE